MEFKTTDSLEQAETLLEEAKRLIIKAMTRIELVAFDNEFLVDTVVEASGSCSAALESIRIMKVPRQRGA